MNEELRETMESIFADLSTFDSHGAWQEAVASEAHGRLVADDWDKVGVPESLGGQGGDLGDHLAIAFASGHSGMPSPLPDLTGVAAWMLGVGRLHVEPGVPSPIPVPCVLDLHVGGSGPVVTGVAPRVPWGRWATHFVVPVRMDGDQVAVALVARARVDVAPGCNLAGEPRDELRLDNAPLMELSDPVSPVAGFLLDLRLRGAIARAAQMSGALERALSLSLRYSSERVQFGRAIAGFQAVQQQLALMAGEVVAARVSVEMTEGRRDGRLRVAAATAKLRAGKAAGEGARLAHQIHGAIGVTQEYDLHRHTRALWAWRDEYGNDHSWATWLASQYTAMEKTSPWSWVVHA